MPEEVSWCGDPGEFRRALMPNIAVVVGMEYQPIASRSPVSAPSCSRILERVKEQDERAEEVERL